ncbi:hypothetical protein COY07_06230 [Candidatus Peregrinibacteria bacterium CG_4_10_14_0_2_um_filter_43_11]|nr:MAG: hypothetical protein COY07_06230 [Candidatus Peregrinibacteria bacterium CG_4_10_14_0_2_um_filter_43_11]
MIPQVTGISELQRKGNKVLDPIREDKEQIVLLSDRNHVFGAIMNIEHYKELLQMATDQEKDFWLGVMEKSFDFWMDPSNDVYEKCL